jgi:hypothetical protein
MGEEPMKVYSSICWPLRCWASATGWMSWATVRPAAQGMTSSLRCWM